jgi:hypothetical protein
MLNVDLMLAGSEFFSGLDENLKIKFKNRLLTTLNRKLGEGGEATSLAEITITEDNVMKIQKHIGSIRCFSWFGLIFGPLWAAYHRIPLGVAVVVCLFLLAWPVLLVDHDMYLKLNDALTTAGFGIGIVFAMYGRAWLVSAEVTRYLEIRFPAQRLSKLPGFCFWGTGFNRAWVRVLFLVCITALFTGIEVGLEMFLYG